MHETDLKLTCSHHPVICSLWQNQSHPADLWWLLMFRFQTVWRKVTGRKSTSWTVSSVHSFVSWSALFQLPQHSVVWSCWCSLHTTYPLPYNQKRGRKDLDVRSNTASCLLRGKKRSWLFMQSWEVSAVYFGFQQKNSYLQCCHIPTSSFMWSPRNISLSLRVKLSTTRLISWLKWILQSLTVWYETASYCFSWNLLCVVFPLTTQQRFPSDRWKVLTQQVNHSTCLRSAWQDDAEQTASHVISQIFTHHCICSVFVVSTFCISQLH